MVVLLLLGATVAGALTAQRGAERAESAALDQRLEDAASVVKALSDQVVSGMSDVAGVAALTNLDPATFEAAVRPRLQVGALRRLALVDARGAEPRVIAAAGGQPLLIDRFERDGIAAQTGGDDRVVRVTQDRLLAPTLLAYATPVERHRGVYVWAEVEVASVLESFFVANEVLRGALFLGRYPDAILMLATNARPGEEVPRTGAHIDVMLGADGAGFLVGEARTPLIPRWAGSCPGSC